jgi:hypothetical protein
VGAVKWMLPKSCGQDAMWSVMLMPLRSDTRAIDMPVREKVKSEQQRCDAAECWVWQSATEERYERGAERWRRAQ